MPVELKQFLGEGPYPFPLEKVGEFIEAHSSNSTVVLLPRTYLDLPCGIHSHGSYEFLIPFTKMPVGLIEDKKIPFEVNKLFPINSGQSHGPSEERKGCKFLAFQMDEKFVRRVARSVYGKNQVFFDNRSCNYSVIRPFIDRFIEESRGRQAGHEMIMDFISTEIAVSLFRTVPNNLPVLLKENNYTEKDKVKRATEYIIECYNYDYSMKDIAKLVNLSPYHFIRVFKTYTGMTPYDYLLNVKMEKAKEMLRKGREITITQVCFMCGFNNLSHFTAAFKRRTGVSPTDYRKAF